MRFSHRLIIGLGLTLLAGAVLAQHSQQNAESLGQSLTLWGAEQAGNADKSIPAYTGGLPPDTVPAGWKKGSGRYVPGPYDNEKPLFSITASNYEKYADHLTEGQIALLKKYPSFRFDVYPTHRSVAFPNNWLSHCKYNAQNAKLLPNSNGIAGASSCVPFPIPSGPEAGAEVMWNNVLTAFNGTRSTFSASSWLVDSSGNVTDVGRGYVQYVHPYAASTEKAYIGGSSEILLIGYKGPPSQVGTQILQKSPIDYNQDKQLSWSYTPGTRRVRLAPEFAYDTPISFNGGALNYDEIAGFSGALDRYDWKLVGKKEVYVLYNANRAAYAPQEQMLDKNHLFNPDLARWELHRCWVVEAKLKPGQRHTEPRRTFYVDEDTWRLVASDAYDQAGALSKVDFNGVVPAWDVQTFAPYPQILYDLSRNTVYIFGFARSDNFYKTLSMETSIPDMAIFDPGYLTSSGIR